MRTVSERWAVKEGSRDSSPQWEQIRGIYRLGDGTAFFPTRARARNTIIKEKGIFARPVRVRMIVEEIE